MIRKENFLLQAVGGENLLVPIGAQVMDTNGIITLNETAAFIWDLLEKDCTIEDLAAAIADRFEVTMEQAVSDVRSFVDKLDQNGLLE